MIDLLIHFGVSAILAFAYFLLAKHANQHEFIWLKTFLVFFIGSGIDIDHKNRWKQIFNGLKNKKLTFGQSVPSSYHFFHSWSGLLTVVIVSCVSFLCVSKLFSVFFFLSYSIHISVIDAMDKENLINKNNKVPAFINELVTKVQKT